MKRHFAVIGIIILLCVVLPLVAIGVGGKAISAKNTETTGLFATTQPPTTAFPQTQPSQISTVPPTTQHQERGIYIPVITAQGETVMMELEDYLEGVVLAEMPAYFEIEALKAQAVAARTFTLNIVENKLKHNGAVCLKSSCCQAYVTEEAYCAKGGTQEGVEKIRSAVTQTCGEVLLYNGKLIQATYFSCSGGSTEDAADVWGGDVPYLQSVESPGEEGATPYSKTVTFTAKEFSNKLGLSLTGTPDSWFGKVTYTEGGGVKTMVIGGITYTGTKLRKLLSLNSTKFTIKTENSKITVVTQGFGHRVGMSQYGAEAMAVLGSSYQQILAHYFQGTELTKWDS